MPSSWQHLTACYLGTFLSKNGFSKCPVGCWPLVWCHQKCKCPIFTHKPKRVWISCWQTQRNWLKKWKSWGARWVPSPSSGQFEVYHVHPPYWIADHLRICSQNEGLLPFPHMWVVRVLTRCTRHQDLPIISEKSCHSSYWFLYAVNPDSYNEHGINLCKMTCGGGSITCIAIA